ncbi:MAG: hypothetical protein AAF401_17455 [Pseudomonadota bacterium]
MLQTAPAGVCACAQQGEEPRTLADLERLGPVEFLGDSLRVLALIGTELSDSLISTYNGAALLMGRGGLAAYQDASMPLNFSSKRTTLRICAEAPVRLLRSTRVQNGAPVLCVANGVGDVSLKIQTDGGYDACAINAMETYDPAPSVGRTTRAADNVISLSPVRYARRSWDTGDVGTHLNDIIADCGQTRRSMLPHVGGDNAWAVAPNTVSSLITFLAEKGVRHARLVPGDGYVQADIASEERPQLLDQILVITGVRRNFALDLSQINSAWVTRIGDGSQLEIYRPTGKAVAVLAAVPEDDPRMWNALLESLPRIRK